MSIPSKPSTGRKAVHIGWILSVSLAMVFIFRGTVVSLLVIVGWFGYGAFVFISNYPRAGRIVVSIACLALCLSGCVTYVRDIPNQRARAAILDIGADAVITTGRIFVGPVVYVSFGNNIGDEEVHQFVQLKAIGGLHHLRFRQSRLSDRSLEDIGKLKSLRLLVLDGLNFTDAAVRRLCEQLPDCDIYVDGVERSERQRSIRIL